MSTIRCTHRTVVKDGDQLRSVLSRLTELCGPPEEAELFQELFLFTPLCDANNMNLIKREIKVEIKYKASVPRVCQISHSGAPLEKFPQAATVTETEASANVRRTFLKAGFLVKADHAQKGLLFKTRNNQKIALTRPYNATLRTEALYQTGAAAWDALPGAFPFGSDYLLEITQNTGSEATVQVIIQGLKALVDKLKE